MKRILITLFVFVFFAISEGLVFANGPLPLAIEDPEGLESSNCTSFTAEAPGNWGGEYSQGAVTAHPDEDEADDAGYCTLSFEVESKSKTKARRLELRVLDGMADDSFEVYVMNPAEKWVRVYKYSDQHDTEKWITHQIRGFPAGKGQGNAVEVKILLTGEHWANFDTYGQLAVDYMAAYEH